MNAPFFAGATVLGWFTFTADGRALAAVAGVLFFLAGFWSLLATLESWRVLRRFSRRASFNRTPKS